MAEKVTEKEQLLDEEQAKEIVATVFRAAEALASVDDISKPITVEIGKGEGAAGRLGELVAEIRTKAAEVANKVCEDRRDTAGSTDDAIKDALKDRKEVELPENESPAVAGRLVADGSREPVGGLQVIARTRDGEVVGEQTADAAGAFAIELNEYRLEELRLEVLDASGAPVAVSNLKLSTKVPTAKFITIAVPAPPADGDEKDRPGIGGKVVGEQPAIEVKPGNRTTVRRRAAG